MNYFVTKQTLKNEWRIYLDQDVEDELIVYKGHKLAIEPKHLLEFLDYRQEKSTGKLYFLDYQNMKESPDTKDTNMWISGSTTTIDKIVDQSWNSLQNRLKQNTKNFRKIVVTRVNI
jgi:hypothetical protein